MLKRSASVTVVVPDTGLAKVNMDSEAARPWRKTAVVDHVHVCPGRCLHLSVLDLQIIRGVTEGLGNKAIALRLNRNEQTIKNRLHRLFDVVGADGRPDFVAWAFRQGLVK